jgi:hypothetical protein
VGENVGNGDIHRTVDVSLRVVGCAADVDDVIFLCTLEILIHVLRGHDGRAVLVQISAVAAFECLDDEFRLIDCGRGDGIFVLGTTRDKQQHRNEGDEKK